MLKKLNESQKYTIMVTTHFIETLLLYIEQRLKSSLDKINGVVNLFKLSMNNIYYFEKERNMAGIQQGLQKSRLYQRVLNSDKNEPDKFAGLNKSFTEFEQARKQAMIGTKEMSNMIKEKILDVTLQESTLGSEKAIQSTYNNLVSFH